MRESIREHHLEHLLQLFRALSVALAEINYLDNLICFFAPQHCFDRNFIDLHGQVVVLDPLDVHIVWVQGGVIFRSDSLDKQRGFEVCNYQFK